MCLKTNGRITWVDNAKYIAMLSVILAHLFNVPNYLFQFFNCMVPIFFFCSGYVYNCKYNFRSLIYNKFKNILIPWFLFSNINIFLSHIFSFNEHENIKIELLKNLLQIRDYGDNLWFLSCLFIAFIPFYFLTKLANNNSKCRKFVFVFSLILSMLSLTFTSYFDFSVFSWNKAALPWHLEYVFVAVFFMILGFYYKKYFESKWFAITPKHITIILFLLYILSLCLNYMFSNNNLLYIVGYNIEIILGILFIINISKLMKPNKLRTFIGQNTLIYFCIHGKAISLIQKIFISCFSNLYYYCINNTILQILLLVTITYLVAIVLVFPTILINNYFPFIRKKKEKNLHNFT